MQRHLRRHFRSLAGLALATLPAGAIADGGRHALSDLVAIPLAAGSNRIEHFAADGRPGLVTLGWRDNGNAHGYHVFLVLMPTAADADDWSVVGVESSDPKVGDDDIVRDDPHTGEDAVTAVRFAHGRIDGTPATLLLVASRTIAAAGIPAAAPVRYQVYRLAPNERGLGTADYFQRIDSIASAKPYCNAELALSQQFGIPLAADYQGPDSDDGCP